MNAEKWWHEIGSGMAPQPGEDWHEHARRVCKAAFLAGQSNASKEQEITKLSIKWPPEEKGSKS